MPAIFLLELKEPSKPIYPNFNLNTFSCIASLSQKTFSTSLNKNVQKLKNVLFKHSEHSFLNSRNLQNHFVRSFLCLNFNLNSFWCFALFSQKMISTLSFKNFQKTEKCPFQTIRTFVFELKVAWKLFPKKLPMTKFWFK